jgi:hypothetical protein
VTDRLETWKLLRAVVSLAGPDGIAVPEYLLHVDGEQAWWRWADEPFS